MQVNNKFLNKKNIVELKVCLNNIYFEICCLTLIVGKEITVDNCAHIKLLLQCVEKFINFTPTKNRTLSIPILIVLLRTSYTKRFNLLITLPEYNKLL